MCSLSDFRLARSLSLSVGAWLPSAAPDSARALDWAAADFCLANSVGGGGQAMGSASPPAGWQHRGEGVAALHLCATFPRAREGGASASGFDPAAPARSYGDCSARADRNRWLRVGCGVCALWHFRLGDRALIRGRAGAERRAANSWSPWSPMLADGEARRCFLFGTWRSAVAELFGNSRSQQLAAGQPSDVLARCWILASAERDRSLNLLRKGSRVTPLRYVSSRARGRCLSQRFRSGGAGAELWGLFGASRSKPLAEGWLWRVCALAFQAG